MGAAAGHVTVSGEGNRRRDLHAGEEDELESERERLANFQRIQNALASAYDVFDNAEYNPVDALGEVMQQLESIADLGEDYRALSETINDAYYSLQDAQADLSKEIDGLEWDENRLNEIEERLALIQQLKRKYGDSVDDILAYGQRAHKELGTMEPRVPMRPGLMGVSSNCTTSWWTWASNSLRCAKAWLTA